MTAVITDRDSAVCSAQPRAIPAERETAPMASQTGMFPVHSAVTERVRSWAAELSRPVVWTDRPASLAGLSTYAHKGAWASQESSFIRGLGVWWCRLVALPVTVACRYLEWFAQRPGRFFAIVGLIALFWLGR